MRKIFADSSYWIGLRDKRDECHLSCRKIATWVVAKQCRLVVTPFIFGETYAYFSRAKEIRNLVIRDFWENPVVQFEQASYQDQQVAVEILKDNHDKTYSFADAISFTIMSRVELNDVITFDRHFRQFEKFNVIDGEAF